MEAIIGVGAALLLVALTFIRPGAGVALALCMPMIHPGIGPEASWLGVATPGLLLLSAFAKAIISRGFPDQNSISFIDIAMMAWMSLLPVSVLVAGLHEISIMSSMRIVYMAITFYFVTRLLCYSVGVSQFCQSFMLSSVVFGVFITALALHLDESASEFTARLTIGNTYIGLSNYITYALLCALYVVFYMKDSVAGPLRMVSLVSAPFLFYGMLLCNTRGVVVALILALIFLLFRTIFSSRISRQLAVRGIVGTFIAVVGGVTAAILNPETWARMASKFAQLGDSGGDSEATRIEHITDSFDMFASSPLVGQGIGSFEKLYTAYPHNLVLETMAEMGLMGLVLLMIVLVGSMVVTLRYQSVNAMFISALLLFQLFESQVSLAFWMNKNLFVFVGMATALHLLHMSSHRSRKVGGGKKRRGRRQRVGSRSRSQPIGA